jgi:hypothetical protein
VIIAQVNPANDASQSVEFEEARSAFLSYDFLNFDLPNQQSFMPPDLSAWRCRSDRFACVIGAGDVGALAARHLYDCQQSSTSSVTLAAANHTVSPNGQPGLLRTCIDVFSKPNSASLAAVCEKIRAGRRNSFP